MIKLPVLERLDIDQYGMFPGTESPGLHATFESGLTLVLGANGLGKTTLVTILFRLLTGPSDIPNFASGELGTRRLAKDLSRAERRIFAERVMDGAADAQAKLAFHLGGSRVDVTRRLADLAIVALAVDDTVAEATEDDFKRLILDLAGVSSFGDWLLALRHLVFYFEDRRALIWDASAQRQLLRLLFLPPSQAAEWTDKEREILELDSDIRNRRYVLRRDEQLLVQVQAKVETAGEVRQQLQLFRHIQTDETAALDEMNEQLVSATAERDAARLNALTAEQDHEVAMRSLERLELRAIEAAFPNATEVAKYIVGQILAEDKCLTCGSDVPEFAQTIRDRIADIHCPICGSDMAGHESGVVGPHQDHEAAVRLVEDLEIQLKTSVQERSASEKAYTDLLSQISELTARTTKRAAEIQEITRLLPPEEQQVTQQRVDLAARNALLLEKQEQITKLRRTFERFVSRVSRQIASQKDAIKSAFDLYAKGFLLEDCVLVWSPSKSRVGQEGDQIDFAAFAMDMTGSNFQTRHRRNGPDQVSESQREFIDLSFRMALIQVASEHGTLVIDAPESSLDAVFATRAAAVLTRFCASDDANRLIVTSNLVDGDLIPELLRCADIHLQDDPRVVDLLKIATPTAAVRELHEDYVKVRANIFRRAWQAHP